MNRFLLECGVLILICFYAHINTNIDVYYKFISRYFYLLSETKLNLPLPSLLLFFPSSNSDFLSSPFLPTIQTSLELANLSKKI